MAERALLDSLRGSRSQRSWAAALGLPQQTVNGWFNGSEVGKEGLVALLVLHPERRDEIIAAFDNRREAATA